ncbi:MAG: tyrosine-type recombinase/integrase [Enterobacteriaceae bacterium]
MSLTDTAIRNARPLLKPYKLSDTQGLYLLIKPNNSKLWYLKYRFDGKEKKLAFGAYPTVTLANAREQRNLARVDLSQRIDPGLKKQREKQARKSGSTFEEVARSWHSSNRRWSESHSGRILRSLELHLFPLIGKIPITDITASDLLVPLRTTEKKGNLEVAARLQQRISGIMRLYVGSLGSTN